MDIDPEEAPVFKRTEMVIEGGRRLWLYEFEEVLTERPSPEIEPLEPEKR